MITGWIYALEVRASDANGNVQPVDEQWNFGGYAARERRRAVKSFYK